MTLLHQPCFTYVDKVRCEAVRPLIKECVDELDMAYIRFVVVNVFILISYQRNTRFADAQDCIEHNSANLNFLEDQLVSIQSKLNSKRLEEQSLRVAIEDSYEFLTIVPQLHLGLGIR